MAKQAWLYSQWTLLCLPPSIWHVCTVIILIGAFYYVEMQEHVCMCYVLIDRACVALNLYSYSSFRIVCLGFYCMKARWYCYSYPYFERYYIKRWAERTCPRTPARCFCAFQFIHRLRCQHLLPPRMGRRCWRPLPRWSTSREIVPKRLGSSLFCTNYNVVD